MKVLGISAYFLIRSIYTYVVWCDLKGKWEDRKWRRSPKSDKKLYKLCKKWLDCTSTKGCVSEPLLHREEQLKFVVMCILHLVIRVCDYLTKFIRKKCKDLTPATSDCVQDRLNCAKTKISLQGHASLDRGRDMGLVGELASYWQGAEASKPCHWCGCTNGFFTYSTTKLGIQFERPQL